MKMGLAFLALLLAPHVGAEKAVDDLVQPFMASHEIPGMAVAVVHRGKILVRRGYGKSDLEKGVSVSPDTVFPLASLSKPLLAMATLKLVEEGKLRLDDPIGKFIADVPGTWKQITIRSLMDQTAGVPDHFNTAPLHPMPDEKLTTDEIIRRLVSLPLRNNGGRYAYSNGHYALLAKVVDSATRETQASFLSSKLFEPLQMTSSGVMDSEWLARCAKGYRRGPNGPAFEEPINPSWTYGGGHLASSLTDLIKWESALTSEKILRKSSLQLINADQRPLGYSLGWALGSSHNVRFIVHDGRLPGCWTNLTHYPELKLTVILLCNNGDFSIRLQPLVHSLAGLVEPRLVEPVPNGQDGFAALSRWHRRFLDMVLTNDIDISLVDAAVEKDFLPLKRQHMARDFQAGGRIESFELLSRVSNDANGFTSKYRVVQKERTIPLTIVCNSTGLIIGIFYEI